MKNLSILFAMTLSLAAFGCKQKVGDCAAAIDHGMELSKADMAKMGDSDQMLAKLRELGVQHCKDDKWSDEALKCMVDAKTETDAQGCYHKLTADQSDKMNKAAMEVMTPPAPAGGSAMGSAAVNSDTGGAGSAMAGSAGGGGMSGSGSAAAPK